MFGGMFVVMLACMRQVQYLFSIAVPCHFLYIVSVTLLLFYELPCRFAVKGDGGRDLAISLGAVRSVMIVSLCHCFIALTGTSALVDRE